MDDIKISYDESFKDSLLYNAAWSWKSVSRYQYKFLYGYRKQVYTLLLSFSADEFLHLSGFQYLKDLAVPRYNSSKLFRGILDGSITQAQIEKGMQYESLVRPRLSALLSIKDILDNSFTLFSFKPRMYPFVTNIKADYLISSTYKGQAFVFLFGGSPKSVTRDCICRSIFIMDGRDYEENQRPYAILKKTRTDLSTNEESVLFVKPGFEDPSGSSA